jgi:hypothetical protein
MAFLAQLWLPIVVSGVIVFFVSALFWMVSPHHQMEWGKLPNEAAVLAALRANPAAPGQYTIPGVNSPAERKNPEWRAALEQGPTAIITLRKGGMGNMGAQMMQSLVGNLVVSFFVAYVASHALPADANYLQVFRIVGATSFMSYAFASIPDSVWFGRPWSSFFKQCFDALVYAGLTAGVFGWLWK